jgi:hypothetical protein
MAIFFAKASGKPPLNIVIPAKSLSSTGSGTGIQIREEEKMDSRFRGSDRNGDFFRESGRQATAEYCHSRESGNPSSSCRFATSLASNRGSPNGFPRAKENSE